MRMYSNNAETAMTVKLSEENTLEALNTYGELIIKEESVNRIPNDIMFPDELNFYLREQIQYYAHENAMVKRNLSDLECEYEKSKMNVTELEQKLNNYESILNKTPYLTSNQVATTKIVELTKRLREKTAEVESLKTKYTKLEKQLIEIKSSQIEETSVQPEIKAITFSDAENEIKKLQEKLNHVNNKLAESRNLNLQLKNDLKMANKYLQQEIGENFESIQAIYNLNSNWRGRAQIICDLQQKNNELREKLKCTQEKKSLVSEESLISKDKSKETLFSKENDDLKSKYGELKRKYDCMKSRLHGLDTDLGLFKSKFNMLKEQSEKDQKMIEALTNQLSNTDNKAEKAQKDRNIRKLQTEKNKLIKEIEEIKIVVNALKQQIEEKDREIENLKKYLASPMSPNEFNRNQESDNRNLLKFIEEQNNRLSAERNAHTKTQLLLKIEKQKAAKAESLAAKLELDTNRSGHYCSSVSLKVMDSSLNDQLELAQENIKALQTRLEIEQYERKADLQEFAKLLENIETEPKK